MGKTWLEQQTQKVVNSLKEFVLGRYFYQSPRQKEAVQTQDVWKWKEKGGQCGQAGEQGCSPVGPLLADRVASQKPAEGQPWEKQHPPWSGAVADRWQLCGEGPGGSWWAAKCTRQQCTLAATRAKHTASCTSHQVMELHFWGFIKRPVLSVRDDKLEEVQWMATQSVCSKWCRRRDWRTWICLTWRKEG